MVSSDFQDYTLVVPTITTGNIPQLTVDLMLYTYNFVRMAKLDSTYLYPFSGPIDSGNDEKYSDLDSLRAFNGISTSIEAYRCDELKIVLIQQRSPIIATYTRPFVETVVVPFAKQFKRTVVLSSSDFSIHTDYAATNIHSGVGNCKFEWFEGDELLPISKLSLVETREKYSYDSIYANLLIELLLGSSTELNLLLAFVYEGDNFNDAEESAHFLIHQLGLPQKDCLIRPNSWKGVYGDKSVPVSMEEGLFG